MRRHVRSRRAVLRIEETANLALLATLRGTSEDVRPTPIDILDLWDRIEERVDVGAPTSHQLHYIPHQLEYGADCLTHTTPLTELLLIIQWLLPLFFPALGTLLLHGALIP